jgi:hypothetical protein
LRWRLAASGETAASMNPIFWLSKRPYFYWLNPYFLFAKTYVSFAPTSSAAT